MDWENHQTYYVIIAFDSISTKGNHLTYISTNSTAILLYCEGASLHIRNLISSVVGVSRDLVKYGGLASFAYHNSVYGLTSCL